MNNYFKHNPWYKKALKEKENIFNWFYLQYKKDLSSYLYKFKNTKLLEIWCGMWKFAYFCDKIWVKDYTWIDIDDYFFDANKKDFPNYSFIKSWFQKYLTKHKNELDIIFVSHVFEHLDEKERIEMIESIYWWLKENGVWINYMPNADNFLTLWHWRWGDATHKCIYTTDSFEQVINFTECKFEIKNFNIYIYEIAKLKEQFIYFFVGLLNYIFRVCDWTFQKYIRGNLLVF